jgi:hypothetical protein
MKKILYLVLLIANFCFAQPSKNTTSAFNCAEIEFWQSELVNQFKSIKLVSEKNDGNYTGNRTPKGFERCFFTTAATSDWGNTVNSIKTFQTEPEAVAFINSVKQNLDQCLKNQKFTIENLKNHECVYTNDQPENKGNTKIDIFIDGKHEVVDGMLTSKIIGYSVKLEMGYKKVFLNDDITEDEAKKEQTPEPAAQRQSINKIKPECEEINFWETKLLENFQDMAVEVLGDGKYESQKVVSGFDILNFYMRPDEFRTPRFSTRKEDMKTYAEALAFYNTINKQLNKCLTEKQYKGKAIIDDSDKKYLTHSYTKKLGDLGDKVTVYLSITNNNQIKPEDIRYDVTLDFEKTVE